jgi:hypothetical protein
MTPSMFGLDTYPELQECVEEFGCTVLESKDVLGNCVYFAVATNQDTLMNMTSETLLPGVVVRFDEIYDQFVEL